VAFIRAVNVGGHVVKGASLVELFEALDLTSVSTVANSGNVLFDMPAGGRDALERRLTAHLSEALGFTADTFVRTAPQLHAVRAHDPFVDVPVTEATRVQVGFFGQAVPDPAQRAVLDLAAGLPDLVAFRGREMYWRYEGRSTDSELGGPRLTKALGIPGTFRVNTALEKIAAGLDRVA
jgi:uncharacterized protein (DUF1697 family)